MPVRIVRLGSPRSADEGTRIGTVRRPPRGVPKTAFASGDWYDVWLPELSPSAELVKLALASQKDSGAREWARFVRHYRAEMAEPAAAHAIALLVALSADGSFSVGCYCEDEARCHRSVLRGLLADAGARIG